MPRAILIDPNEDPTFIDLDADVRSHLANLFPANRETVELHRNDWTHFNTGPGIKACVRESALPGDAPNPFVNRLIDAFGGGWSAAGHVVLMALHGADVVDLDDETWEWLVNVASGTATVPFRQPKVAAVAQVWFFNGDDEEPSADAYATLAGAQRAAVTDYEAGDSGPIFADVTYTWRPLDESRHDHWCLDVDGTFSGWMVWPVRLVGERPK